MTTWFDRLIGTHADARARPRGWHTRASLLSALLLIVSALVAVPARAQDMRVGRVTSTTEHGFTRMVFKFDQPVPARVSMTWPIMIIHFDKPVDVSVDRLNEGAPTYISAARRDPDGAAIRIALVRKVKFHVIPAGQRLFVDLLPEDWSGLLPGLPQDVIDELAHRAGAADKLIDKERLADQKALADSVRVKVATQPTFSRYVFDLPIPAHVDPERGEGTYTLRFDRPIKWDLADAMAALPVTVSSIDAVNTERSSVVQFKLNGDPQLRTFREGNSFALDIGHGDATPNQALAAGAAQLAAREPASPAIAPPETMPAQGAQAGKAAKPAATAQAPSAHEGAPAMVDMPAPNSPPGAQPAPPPSPIIPVPTPGKNTETPSLTMKMAAADRAPAAPPAPKPSETKPAMKKPETAKPPMAKPRMAKTEMAKPDAHKPDMAKPMAATDTHKPNLAKPMAKPGMSEPAMAAQGDKPKSMPKPLEPIASPSKMAPPKTAMADATTNKPAMSKPSPAKVADAHTPPPNPGAAVVVGLHRSGQLLKIEFPFAVPTPAAVFRRGDMVWLVFENPAEIDLGKLSAETGGAIQAATVKRTDDGATVVRIRLNRPRLVSVDSDGPAWMVTIADTVTNASKPLSVIRTLVGRDRANLVVPFDHPGKMHRLQDPEVGDELLVMTGLAPVRGFLRSRDFVELEMLASRQGVVVRPIADDVTGKIGREGVAFSRPGGLALSAAPGGQQSAASFRTTAFDSQLWSLDRDGSYFHRQSELVRMAAAAPPGRRRVARINLARFYLARHMSAEAMGVLNVAFANDDDVTGSVLKSVASLMLGRPKDALKELSQPQVGNQLNAPIWRAIAYARQGKWTDAHKLFQNVEATVASLPIELQRIALLEALHAAIEVRDFGRAERLINLLDGIGVLPTMKPEFDVLVGRLAEGLGRNNDALAKYQAAAESEVRPAAAQGKLREIELLFHLGQMSRQETVAALETLTTLWRGDETEAEGLRLLAHLYTKEARYREAFHVMRVALLAHPNSDLTRRIQDEAAATFESLFLSHKGDTLPPIDALGLFYDYRELTPIGRRGDEVIRRLADRLVAVDLLGQAAKLLQHQVDKRLEGAARAQVAARLAVIYLMDHKPDRALATMQATRAAQLNNELRDQRLLLQARALSDLGRYDLALEVIKDIKAPEATRLRADILWAAHRWQKAAEQIELLYGQRWREFRPLDSRERFDILRAAIGYALANDGLGLQRFREKYAAKMESGPDGHAFEVVSAPIGTGNAEFRAVATHIASLDTLSAFLNDMRKRYPDSKALSGQGEADGKTAPEVSPPETAPSANAQPGPGAAATTPKGTPGTPPVTPKPPASGNSAVAEPDKPKNAGLPVPPRVPLEPDKPTGSIGWRR